MSQPDNEQGISDKPYRYGKLHPVWEVDGTWAHIKNQHAYIEAIKHQANNDQNGENKYGAFALSHTIEGEEYNRQDYPNNNLPPPQQVLWVCGENKPNFPHCHQVYYFQ